MNRPPVSRPPLSVVTSPPAMPVTYCIHTSYKKLLSKMGMAVVLFHFQGQSVSELADLMGVSRKGAESLLSRARAALRQRLASLLD